MTTTVSVKMSDETAAWLDSRPGGRSAYLRLLVDRARRAEIDQRDLAVIDALGGDVSDVVLAPDDDEWAAGAAEWDGVDL